MNLKSNKSGRRRYSGATLIEAVAGLAILGSILVSLIVAGANFHRQNEAAKKIETACKLLDELLESNEKSLSRLADIGEGDLPEENWHWKAEILPSSANQLLNCRKMKLSAFAPDSEKPDATVEILIAENN